MTGEPGQAGLGGSLKRRGRVMSVVRSYQATEPGGTFTAVDAPLREPGRGEVRLIVEAVGICASDHYFVNGAYPVEWPATFGHEIAGRIEALGEGVRGWAVGDRVAVGWFGGSCGVCDAVVAIARGAQKGELARQLGAQHYIDSTDADVPAKLRALGGARVILATAMNSAAMSGVIDGLRYNGELLVVGAVPEPVQVSPFQIVASSKTLTDTRPARPRTPRRR